MSPDRPRASIQRPVVVASRDLSPAHILPIFCPYGPISPPRFSLFLDTRESIMVFL